MDALDKMWLSFIALGLMAVVTLIVAFARTKTKGVIRFILMLVAFVLFIFSVLCAIVSIF